MIRFKAVHLKRNLGELGLFELCEWDDPESCGEGILKYNTEEETWDTSLESASLPSAVMDTVAHEYKDLCQQFDEAIAKHRDILVKVLENTIEHIKEI